MKYYEIEIERRTKHKLILATGLFDASDAEDKLIISGNLRGFSETCLADEDSLIAFGKFAGFSDSVSLVGELSESEAKSSPLRFWIRNDEYELVDFRTQSGD